MKILGKSTKPIQMNNKWFPERYSEIAIDKFILKKAYQIVEEKLPFLQFFYCPAFSETIYLQIILQKESIRLVKSTLQEVGGKKQVKVEFGNLSGTLVSQLNQAIESLKVNTFGLEEEITDGRDGYLAELTLGKGFHSTTFSWSKVFMPNEWDVLTPLVKLLLEIDDSVAFEQDYFIEVETTMEEDNDSLIIPNKKSMLIEYTRTKTFIGNTK